MSLNDYGTAADRAFQMAHKFLYEFGVRWFPVDIELIAQQNWRFGIAEDMADIVGCSLEYYCNHVMRSDDGATFYDSVTKQYEIVINYADSIPQKRVRWTCAHEVAHIYLGHYDKYGVKCLATAKLPADEYAQMEFEADLFAGEVLASKWLLRDMYINVENEDDISQICDISDRAALNRYRAATREYPYIPTNVLLSRERFKEYLKEVTVCMSIDQLTERHIGDVSRFASENVTKPFIVNAPKPKFIRVPGNCPWCDSGFDRAAAPNFCVRCGKPLKPSATVAPNPCTHVNPAEAVYCERCGNKVLRIRQGFCFDESEI